TYKFEKAAELGAAGCFIVHDTERAGYPWEVVRESWSGEQFDLAAPDKNMGRAEIEGWITSDHAKVIFETAGKDFDALKKAAVSWDFKPVPLGLRAKLTIKNFLRPVDSRNVIAKLPGSDPKLKDEHVIYVAHWDHFGMRDEVVGSKIYHGAKDNASGTAALLELARAFKRLKTAPCAEILSPRRVTSTAPTTSASPNRACRHLTRTRASSTWANHRTGALGCASGIPRRTTTNRLT